MNSALMFFFVSIGNLQADKSLSQQTSLGVLLCVDPQVLSQIFPRISNWVFVFIFVLHRVRFYFILSYSDAEPRRGNFRSIKSVVSEDPGTRHICTVSSELSLLACGVCGTCFFFFFLKWKHRQLFHQDNIPMQYYVSFHSSKNVSFQLIICVIFLAQNINCWCSLEPPHRGGSNEETQSIFFQPNYIHYIYIYSFPGCSLHGLVNGMQTDETGQIFGRPAHFMIVTCPVCTGSVTSSSIYSQHIKCLDGC